MDEVEITRFRALSIAIIEMLIHVGLMDSVSSRWPLEVQENWNDRIDNLIHNIHAETDEIQQFGEAFDEEE